MKEAEKNPTSHSKAQSEAQIETIPGGIYSAARRKTPASDGEQAILSERRRRADNPGREKSKKPEKQFLPLGDYLKHRHTRSPSAKNSTLDLEKN